MNMTRQLTLSTALVAFAVLAVPASAAEPARKAENVIVVTLDGFRWQELFDGADESFMDAKQGGVKDIPGLKKRYLREKVDERREALMPFFWGTVAKKGQVFGNPGKKAAAQITNGLKFSYPGYSEMFCGFADPRIDSNGKKDNPNLSVLEFLNGRSGFKDKVEAVCTWDVFPFIFRTKQSGLRGPRRVGADQGREVDRARTGAERVAGPAPAVLARQRVRRVHDGRGEIGAGAAQAAGAVHRTGRDRRVGPRAAIRPVPRRREQGGPVPRRDLGADSKGPAVQGQDCARDNDRSRAREHPRGLDRPRQERGRCRVHLDRGDGAGHAGTRRAGERRGDAEPGRGHGRGAGRRGLYDRKPEGREAAAGVRDKMTREQGIRATATRNVLAVQASRSR